MVLQHFKATYIFTKKRMDFKLNRPYTPRHRDGRVDLQLCVYDPYNFTKPHQTKLALVRSSRIAIIWVKLAFHCLFHDTDNLVSCRAIATTRYPASKYRQNRYVVRLSKIRHLTKGRTSDAVGSPAAWISSLWTNWRRTSPGCTPPAGLEGCFTVDGTDVREIIEDLTLGKWSDVKLTYKWRDINWWNATWRAVHKWLPFHAMFWQTSSFLRNFSKLKRYWDPLDWVVIANCSLLFSDIKCWCMCAPTRTKNLISVINAKSRFPGPRT